jgi:phosphate-selective porin OprO/OprP
MRPLAALALSALSLLCSVENAAAEEAPPFKVRVSAAFGKGVTISDAEGDTELNIRGRVQVQGAVETNAPDEHGERAAPDVSFLVRRTRLVFQGHVLQRALRYYVQLGTATRDMEPDLLVPTRDAYVEWLHVRDAHVRAGQMKVPFSRERVVSSSALELVDRSNVNAELSLDRDVGVQLYSKDFLGAGKRLRYYAGVFGGDGRNRTAGRAGLLWVARVEALPFGDFDDYVEADLVRTAKPKVAIGFATAYNQSTVRSQSTLGTTFTTGTVDYKHASADIMAKWHGVSLQAEALYRKADPALVGEAVDAKGKPIVEHARPALGAFIQLGVLITHSMDVAARYGEVQPIDGDVVHRDREIGGGLGWFPRGHDLKLQVDYFRLTRDDVDTDRIRLQTQLFF